MPELLTVPEAALKLRLGKATVFQMAQRQELPTVRIGKRVLIPAELLDKWIVEHTREVIVRKV